MDSYDDFDDGSNPFKGIVIACVLGFLFWVGLGILLEWLVW